MSRTRSFRRDVRNKTIARKKRICRAIYDASIGGFENPGAWYKYDGQYSKGKYSLATVNSVHSALGRYMNPKEGKVFNTKYLDLTLMLFWWLQRYKDKTTNQKVQMIWDIMNDNISEIELREKVNQVTQDEIKSREITIDTKGTFPTKGL